MREHHHAGLRGVMSGQAAHAGIWVCLAGESKNCCPQLSHVNALRAMRIPLLSGLA